MKKLEQLKKEMLDAKELYETFKKDNSRDLTEEENTSGHQYPTFSMGAEQSETRMFELTKDKVDEMRKLEQNMRETYSNYVKEYVNSKQK